MNWDDQKLKNLIIKCTTLQKKIGRPHFKPEPRALDRVSAEALQKITDDVSDLRTEQKLTNCLVFHTDKLPGTVLDDEIIILRKQIDVIIIEKLKESYPGSEPICSGHFWYPPQSFMSWHTNSRKLGWRFYLNYAEEPGKSFFRHKDPQTGEIITSWDDIWNYRSFQIQADPLFWHSVYSNTNRFSFGYLV